MHSMITAHKNHFSVNALASLIAAVVASPPFLTNRTISAQGTIEQIFSANSTSTGVGENEILTCLITALFTEGSLYPTVIGYKAHTKSINYYHQHRINNNLFHDLHKRETLCNSICMIY